TRHSVPHTPHSACRVAALLPDAEALDELRVPFDVLRLEIVEEPAALADELQQPAPGMMILRVRLEMFGEVGDALTEQRDLHLGGAGVAGVSLVLADEGNLL